MNVLAFLQKRHILSVVSTLETLSQFSPNFVALTFSALIKYVFYCLQVLKICQILTTWLPPVVDFGQLNWLLSIL